MGTPAQFIEQAGLAKQEQDRGRRYQMEDEQRQAQLGNIASAGLTPDQQNDAIQQLYAKDPSALKRHIENLAGRLVGRQPQPTPMAYAPQSTTVQTPATTVGDATLPASAPVTVSTPGARTHSERLQQDLAGAKSRAQQAADAFETQTDIGNNGRLALAQKEAQQQRQQVFDLIDQNIKDPAENQAAKEEYVRKQAGIMPTFKNIPGTGGQPYQTPNGQWVRPVQQTDGTIVDQPMPAGWKPPAKPDKAPSHITAMVNGKPHVMGFDPATKGFTNDLGIAPPTYAQIAPSMMARSTATFTGDDGLEHRYQFNPSTMKYDTDLGLNLTGSAAHQVFQGAAIEQLAPQVIDDINANRDILGNLGSYIKKGTLGTPAADARAAQLTTELRSFAAMQPALHAFRSQSAAEAFEKMVGGLANNPDATIAAINGLLKTPQTFTGIAKGGSKGAPAPKKQGGATKGIVSLSKARSLPQFKGKSDAEITAAAKGMGYEVKQ